MRLSDLQSKDIVSIRDGKRLGRIIDVEIEDDGRVISLIIEQKRGMRSFVGGSVDSTISFSQIQKIGEDVILVDL